MKLYFFLAILFIGFTAKAQSLKDALYSGKLRTDSGTVIKKGDDLSSKIDTSTRKVPEPVKAKPVAVAMDTLANGLVVQVDSAGAIVDAEPGVPVASTVKKDDKTLWKDYITELTTTLKSEVMTSKKIKDGNYGVVIAYEIGPDGAITLTSVTSTPKEAYLEQQVGQRFTLSAPQMTPLLGVNGKPRTAKKTQVLSLQK